MPIAEDYGVPDFTDFLQAYPDSVREFEKAIRQTIQKYEPRLTGVRVRLGPRDDDLLSLRFEVDAQLATEQEKVPVFFESTVDADGKFSVRGGDRLRSVRSVQCVESIGLSAALSPMQRPTPVRVTGPT